MSSDTGVGLAPMRRLLTQRAFLVPYVAETQSIVGDQLARFALSVLVYDRTNSVVASALTYATSFVPAIFGGFILGGLADRFEHGRVMIAADLVRAGLFVLMTAPGLPIGVMVGILAVAVFLGPAYSAAEVSFLAHALERSAFRVSVSVRSASNQLVQVIGFAVGGVVVVWLHPRGALVVNAATFALSALILTVGLPTEARGRRAPTASGDAAGDEVFAGIWRSPTTRPLMVLTVLMGVFVLPEALAVPFGRHIGASTAQTGVLLSTIPLGSAVGALLLVRVPQRWRWRVSGWAAVGCGLPLLVNAADPRWWVAAVFWLASGVLAAYQVEVIALLVEAVPESERSTQMGRVAAWLLGAQGAGFALGGVIAQAVGIGTAIAALAWSGSVVAAVVMFSGRSTGKHLRPSPVATSAGEAFGAL